jgi:hypothetical protein
LCKNIARDVPSQTFLYANYFGSPLCKPSHSLSMTMDLIAQKALHQQHRH